MDVLLHVENGRPKRPNTDNRGTYVQDGLRPSLSGSPLEDFFTSRMGRISYGHRDIQGIDDGWECATRDAILNRPVFMKRSSSWNTSGSISCISILFVNFSFVGYWNMAAKTLLLVAKMFLWAGNSRPRMFKMTSLNCMLLNNPSRWADNPPLQSTVKTEGSADDEVGSFFRWVRILQ